MSSDQDLFNEDKDKDLTPATPAVDPPQEQSTDYSSLLGMIVNAEGKPKYTTIDEALKGTVHAQAHIANLEQELATLRSQGESSKKVEDLIAALQTRKPDDQSASDNGQPSGVSEADIQALVKNTILDISNKTTQEQNIKSVTSKFKELYGEKASETLYSKAEDLGMSKGDINSLIAKNPAAVFRMLGVDAKNQPIPSPFNSNVNTENFNQKAEPEVKSSMGYVTSKALTSNWLETKARVNKQLGLTN